MRHLKGLIIGAVCALLMAFSPDVQAEQIVRTVHDMAGAEVWVPEHPQRIVSLAPSITEIVYALGLGDRLVGATRFSDYPAKALELPRIGAYNALDVERIAALGPDLCLATKDGNPKQSIDQLRDLGIPVYVGDPTDLQKTMEFIALLADVLGVPNKGSALAASMHRRVQAVRNKVAGLPRPRVFYQLAPSPIRSAGGNTFPGELIELAGGTNLAEERKFYPSFSLEEVVLMAPDVLIVSAMGGLEKDSVVRWKEWPSIPAVHNKRLYVVRADTINRPGPRLVDGLELLARLIHPDVFDSASSAPSSTGATP